MSRTPQRRGSGTPRGPLSPARLVAGAFAVLITSGTLLLLLPAARAGDGGADVVTALFTATSAVCLTGLIVVDTATYWSHFGQAVIVVLIQLGGLGIMTLATFTSWVVAGRIGVKSRLNAAAEGRGIHLGDVRTLLVATVTFTFVAEFIVAVLLTLRFRSYGFDWAASLWEGGFHAVSAFNNAGFGLRSDNLVPYARDSGIVLPVAGAIIIGGLGYPVLLEIALRTRRRSQGITRLPQMSLTARFALTGTTILLMIGWIGYAVLEWRGVFAEFGVRDKLLNSFFQSVTTRTAGFNTVDLGEFHPSSLLLTDVLMFVGGGSGGTAGGVKVTTVAVLVAVVMAEIRGAEHVSAYSRRIPQRTIRQALTVIVLAGVSVAGSIGVMLLLAPEIETNRIVFEVVSAFATVGLSTGITADLPAAGQLLLVPLMYAGRIGPITLVAALAARNRNGILYSHPVERPHIG
ncbi:TrkH family potassium uptake protein [Corynebacterium sp. CCM 8835]|uniref:TrkH family potassium uptake protein n=1 Tax=Corynebacterium antarcticum TaxID=2800405 RepID=UPI00200327A7|nr:potassium transporter TrkG [Corynebacterium antarcticum]MCK7643402.1 TrkH family potassium uptake protein [Corynebacterium antarcticum]MCK7661905.1 TrkH family potassium uptake protein [Corynebacterium antarcticum]MCL0246436.1 TrkH family potassium uptake protein [Corynebacterium antarcticum]MCX7492577.1 TrkH family potassium uptake protein [Corynebacterium antarcticum]MCX7541248.1 TrkH family potassium uptake protein [Corynebacterium antarcticum]